MKKSCFLFFLIVGFLLNPILADIKSEDVDYEDKDVLLQGYVAYNTEARNLRPGILLIHAWKGLGTYEKSKALQLAELGYVVFALDMYGKGTRPETPEVAAKTSSIFKQNRFLMRSRAKAGLSYLKKMPNVDPNQIVVIGYCFGGGVALELARSGAPTLGTISFHGNLDTPNSEDAKMIKGKILAFHGGDDPYVPTAQVLAFQSEMKNAKLDWQLVVYGGAVHAFTDPSSGADPSKGAAYNATADNRSWESMKLFLNELFKR